MSEEIKISHALNYCIINWNKDIMKWEVLYYDMVLARAEEWYLKFQKTHPYCQLMINASQIKKEEAKKQLNAMLERMKNEALRKAQDSSSKPK